MLIDWFTVGAQFVNFAILVVALKFVLYDRVVETMEQRRLALARREAEAAEAICQAERERADLEAERQALAESRDRIIDQSHREAAARRRELLEQARREVAHQQEQWRQSLHHRRERLLVDLQRLTGEKAVTIARRALADMADRSLEEEVVRKLAERLGALAAEERAALAQAARDPDALVVVRTAFDPSDSIRRSLEAALVALVGDLDRPVRWEVDPTVVAGAVICVGALTLGWSVGDYLGGLDRQFGEMLRVEEG